MSLFLFYVFILWYTIAMIGASFISFCYCDIKISDQKKLKGRKGLFGLHVQITFHY